MYSVYQSIMVQYLSMYGVCTAIPVSVKRFDSLVTLIRILRSTHRKVNISGVCFYLAKREVDSC